MTTVLSPHPDLDDNILFDRSARTRWRIGFDRWIGRLLPLLFLVAILPILGMVYWVSEQALPTLTWTIIVGQSPYATDQLGVPIIGTFELMLIATLLSVVLGLFGGVATAELLSPRAASVVRMTANMLVGTPSVIIGFFGFFVFVLYFGWGLSLIAGAVTLSMFMTPYIFRTADLAFTSVPRHIREAALGSGAAPTQVHPPHRHTDRVTPDPDGDLPRDGHRGRGDGAHRPDDHRGQTRPHEPDLAGDVPDRDHMGRL